MKSIAITAVMAFVCILGIQGVSAATQNVNNVNDPINRPYQESSSSACGSANCAITFGTIVAPQTVVQNVSCFFAVSNGTVVSSTALYDGTSTNENFLPVSSYGSAAGITDYAINANTMLFFITGGKPDVVIGSAPGGTINNMGCTTSGYHR